MFESYTVSCKNVSNVIFVTILPMFYKNKSLFSLSKPQYEIIQMFNMN